MIKEVLKDLFYVDVIISFRRQDRIIKQNFEGLINSKFCQINKLSQKFD